MASLVLPTPRSRTWNLAMSETALLAAILVAALALRFGRDTLVLLRYEFGPQLILLSLAILAAMYMLDLYESPVIGDFREIGARLPQALGACLLLLGASARWLPGVDLLGRTWLEALLAGGLGLCGFRTAWVFWHHHPRLSEPVLLVGDNELAALLRQQLAGHTEMGLPVLATLGQPTEAQLALLAQQPAQRFARRLIATAAGGWSSVNGDLCAALRRSGYKLDDGVELMERLTGKLPLDIWAQRSVDFRADRVLPASWLGAKRLLDCAFAGLGLALSWPLLLLIALAIRLDSPGPAFFRQQRVGRFGRRFALYKFRSMRVNPGPVSPAVRDDPRCTRVGKWLRRLRLDELPQLWNVVRGDMSLVGPRPFVPEQEAECVAAIPFYAQRWSVPPGATGWAQINRGYCATLEDNREKLAYDLYYVRHCSAVFDVLIVLQTFKVLLLGRGGR